MLYIGRGTQFAPADIQAQLISTLSAASLRLCAVACHRQSLCRIFDYGISFPNQCRLFEGDVTTMGTIIPSPSSNSTVGVVQLSPNLFTDYGLPCASQCQQSRYLICGSNFTCQCGPHSYWNGSMCLPQTPVLGAPCQQNVSMCREDLNYTCLSYGQCGPLSVYSGVTIADQNTVIIGGSAVGLKFPQEIIVDPTVSDTILVADGWGNQIVRFGDRAHDSNNGSVVVQNWTGNNALNGPFNMFLDVNGGNNLYVSDSGNSRVVLFTGMQSVTPPPKVIAVASVGGNSLSKPHGVSIDSQGNMIVIDFNNHRVLRYAPNSTNGTQIVGTGSANSDSMSLSYPSSCYLDVQKSWLYVADVSNHRIQRFSLNSSTPSVGTTVAGGNGPGNGSHQLNIPYGVWVSNKTGAIYIADTYNHRIQRWNPGASSGVTIAGSSIGIAGSNATMLNYPARLTANANETFLYVSDALNSRVQRFQLV